MARCVARLFLGALSFAIGEMERGLQSIDAALAALPKDAAQIREFVENRREDALAAAALRAEAVTATAPP